ncbi:MAG: bifunctional DNA-formamidopyrimidine glycosylase/DNA-(apurinic or apyrimidinic site) lyase [Erysipelotrichales bacterium]|nr:MAG: bifunctional DNA-formamidopyrimidine glycosylase/DNA-(apurinic or apyrimidinic site) lyase [Erysipelotrichales bacterium]
MPELPEVQTVVDSLRLNLNGKSILSVDFLWGKTSGNLPCAVMAQKLGGKTIREVTRRAKYILIHLDEGTLIVHLRMEGRFFVLPMQDQIRKHSHVLLYLSDGLRVEYNDTRKFGRFYYYDADQPHSILDKLGPEPFNPELTAKILHQATRKKRTMLKVWLLDQTHIAGIGNIYADEICFAAKMSPRQPVGRITRKQWEEILNQTRTILNKAILAGGTTIRSYTSSLGITGRFQITLNAYGRSGLPCHVCGTPCNASSLDNAAPSIAPSVRK